MEANMLSLETVGYDELTRQCELSNLPQDTFSDCTSILTTLMNTRLAINLGSDVHSVKDALASIDPNFNTKAPHHIFTGLVYADLCSDFEFLIQSEGHGVDYVDLINKKMGVANAAREASFWNLARALNFKILQLFIVSNCNFRLFNVATYLLSCVEDLQLDHDDMLYTKQMYELLLRNRLVPLSLYTNFIIKRNSLERLGYNWLFSHALDRGDLLRNLVLRNVVALANYYHSVTYTTLSGVLGLEEGQIDLESLLLDMITSRQLPLGTQIDQLLQTLIYGSGKQPAGDTGTSHRNTLITDVGKLLSQICSKLQLS